MADFILDREVCVVADGKRRRGDNCLYGDGAAFQCRGEIDAAARVHLFQPHVGLGRRGSGQQGAGKRRPGCQTGS
jgi:hypothetical protein